MPFGLSSPLQSPLSLTKKGSRGSGWSAHMEGITATTCADLVASTGTAKFRSGVGRWHLDTGEDRPAQGCHRSASDQTWRDSLAPRRVVAPKGFRSGRVKP